MKIVVTGGCGFIGSHIVDELVNSGYDVIVIDNKSANNDVFYYNDKAVYFDCDINDYDRVVSLTTGVDCIFHLAAESRIGPCIENPILATKTNVLGTCNLLQAAKLNGVSRFIYSSTSSAYGNNNSSPQVETMNIDCLNPYSVTKVAGEALCKMYYDLYKLPTITFRYFNVYGDRQPTKGQYAPVIGIFLRQLKANQPLTIVGDGSQRRDFVNVRDIVSANVLAMNTTDNNCFGKVFNIGSGVNFSVKEIADLISINQVYLPARDGEAKETLANIMLANRLLKFEPKHNVAEWILKKVVDERIKCGKMIIVR